MTSATPSDGAAEAAAGTARPAGTAAADAVAVPAAMRNAQVIAKIATIDSLLDMTSRMESRSCK
ncbi:hypothetical protein [Actinacidiphila guanduensis]|uniref:hypothetical protein n=1 Tax=Actinacidiphila guanduensis TaxID=310781 RepID=UPI00115F97A4|nr:hypothetical protein [Actinacidiphila guanduensis]